MKKRSPIVIIVVAVLLGLVVIVLLQTIVKPTAVVVAKVAIAPGTTITADLVEVRTIPAGGLPAGTYASVDKVVGKSIAVARTKGDYITDSILGNTASAGVPSELAAGHVAISINVDKASAVAGILRAGQTVTLIGMISPDVLSQENSLANTTAQPITTNDGSVSTIQNSMVTATPTAEPVLGPIGKITITGVKVLLVPQNFQYQEISSTSSSQGEQLASSQTTNEDKSIIVLDVPTAPVEIAPGVKVNPVTLIAALNDYGKIYLALESSTGNSVTSDENLTLNLAEFYNQINNSSSTQTK